MNGHAYDPWGPYDPFCRLCGSREPHPDMRPMALVRDAIVGAALVFVGIVSAIVALN